MAEKKGLPWFAWVGIGCGVLLLLVVVAIGGLGLFVGGKVKDLAEGFEERPVYTTAATIARLNPEIELVDADEEAETVTMRNVKTGEVMKFDFADIKSGNFSFEKDGERVDVRSGEGGVTIDSGEGTTRIGAGSDQELPSWVPVPSGTKVQGGYSSRSGDTATGMVQLTDFESVDEVLDFYRKEFERAGYSITDQNSSGGGAAVKSISGQSSDAGRTLTVIANTDADGEAAVSLSYSGKN